MIGLDLNSEEIKPGLIATVPDFHSLFYITVVPQIWEMDAVVMGIVNKPKAFFLQVADQLSRIWEAHGHVLPVKMWVTEGKHKCQNHGLDEIKCK